MPCYHPMVAASMPGRTKNGKSPIKFLGKALTWSGPAPLNGYLLPCRQCIGCHLERSRQWAARLMIETKYHNNACFLTLTYGDDYLPKNNSLNPSHLKTFFKDLRSRLDYYGKEKIKFFAVGEYGFKGKRGINPHYHAALFGGPFSCFGSDDQRNEEEPSRSGGLQFSHGDITAVWPFGIHRYSELTFESAAYVARYCLKKVKGAAAEDYYGGRVPEFQRCSKGMGKGHFQDWKMDIYPGDQVVFPGRGEFLPPPYFDRLLEKVDPQLYQDVKRKRAEAHEKMTSPEWFERVERRYRECAVKQLVVDATLKREGVI